MKFIPFVREKRISDYNAATALARELADRYRLIPCPPETQIKPLIKSLAMALRTENTIVVGVSRGHYLKLKKVLSMIFRREMFVATSVKEDVLLADSEAHELYYMFMEGSEIFKSQSGMYSGYAVSEANKKIIVLPLNNEAYKPMLEQVRTFVFGEERQTQFAATAKARHRTKLYAALCSVFGAVAVLLSMGTAFYFTR